MRDAMTASAEVFGGPLNTVRLKAPKGTIDPEITQGRPHGQGQIVEVEDVHGNKVLLSLAALARGVGHEPAPVDQILTYGDLRIDPQAREVTLADRPITLTRREFDLLLFMAEHPRQVFSKAKLLEAVWSSDTTWQSEATVTEHIRRLRMKLGFDKSCDRGLATVWGVGYRFEP